MNEGLSTIDRGEYWKDLEGSQQMVANQLFW